MKTKIEKAALMGARKKKPETTNETFVSGRYCVVRGNSFGVFAGTVERLEGDAVRLSGARRIWYWDGAASLSQLAAEGVKNPHNCRFAMAVDIVLLGVIEVIPCTEQGRRSIEEVPEWKA